MITSQATILIHRPLEEVFSFVADVGNMVYWCKGDLQAKYTSPPPVAKGATFHNTWLYFLGRKGEGDYQITDFDLNRRLAFASTSGPPLKDAKTFEAAEGGTQVTHHLETRFPLLIQFLEPLLKGMAQKTVESDLGRLKAYLER